MSRALVVALILAVVAIFVGLRHCARDEPAREVGSVDKAGASEVAAHTKLTDNESAAGSDVMAPAAESIAHAGSAEYPVKLDALRAKFPKNRYWELGAPTSDVAVAKARAAHAEADNKMMGKITANEATPEEIHAYYAERRAISKDYIEISKAILDDNADKLPERDRGMYGLALKMHTDRLTQIDRDEHDALTRRGAPTSPEPPTDQSAVDSH
jgi:hypothetical protein